MTTRRDPEGRPTAYDLVRDAGPHLQAIGRLDLASSGLLLFTTDTRLAAALTDPDRAVPRVYVVTVRGAVDDAALGRHSRRYRRSTASPCAARGHAAQAIRPRDAPDRRAGRGPQPRDPAALRGRRTRGHAAAPRVVRRRRAGDAGARPVAGCVSYDAPSAGRVARRGPGGPARLVPVRHPERPARERRGPATWADIPRCHSLRAASAPLGRCGFAALAEQPNVHRNGFGRPRDPAPCAGWRGERRANPALRMSSSTACCLASATSAQAEEDIMPTTSARAQPGVAKPTRTTICGRTAACGGWP